MDQRKRKALEKNGWRVGDAADSLRLSRAEAEYVELKTTLAGALSKRRRKLRLNQTAVADKLETSQSRVAKMEAGDETVSLDLLIRSLLKLGTRPKELGRIISTVDASARRKRVAA